MPAVNFQNNFGTNVTSDQSSGVTTTPINDIPTVDAPYYIALDATNINGCFEIVYVTSDTATNINHAATTYAHSTDEEVRLVVPAVHLNTMQNFPRGFLINGKIVPSVASNNLTVALKTLAGNDPSVTDPIYCRIADTVYAITSALSHTCNAGTNWFNAGSAELATKEIDYFVGLGYNATDGVYIGFTRRPIIIASDLTSGTTTSEIYWAGSQSTFGSADYIENIGRFAATLSAGAGYTWTVPTYTAINLIQRPIYETREGDWVPQLSVSGGTAPTYTNAFSNKYKLIGNKLFYTCVWDNLSGGTAGAGSNSIITTLPFSNANWVENRSIIGSGMYNEASTQGGITIIGATASTNFYNIINTTAVVMKGTDQDQTARFVLFQGHYTI